MPQFNFFFIRPIISCSYLFRFETAEDRANSFHGNISLAFPFLVNFLLLKYQAEKNSPFETNPKMAHFGVGCLILYGLCFLRLQRISQHHPAVRSFAHVLYRCMMFSGYLSVAALASLLYSGSAAVVLLPLSIMLSVGDLLYSVYRRIRAELSAAVHFEENVQLLFLNRLMRRRFGNHRQILPL